MKPEKPAIKTGFFTMETVKAVLTMNDLEEAKQFALCAVKQSEAARSTNVDKALAMINKAKTVRDLGINITNFMLAHPSENLKTIR